MRVNPYLNFNGDCEAAFRFYERCLDGKLEAIMTHGESPIASEVPPAWHDRVLHARLTVGDTVLMGSDSPPEYYAKPQGLYVSLQVDEPDRADRVFHNLAEGGSVTMPIAKTFWAARFGMLVDRFGIPWMVNCEGAAQETPARGSSNVQQRQRTQAGSGRRRAASAEPGEMTMRFMILVKANPDTEAGKMPEEKLFADMAKYHEELVKAGVLLDASGLHPSSKGFRVRYSGRKRSVIDGPFSEAKELIAGYTLIQVKSKEEAIEWAKRFPNPHGEGSNTEIEVRQLYELDDFGPSEAVERFREMGVASRK